ncbi:hypothetical protein GUITHDRAFT_118200 [Guillardia theta CCMP2712]|uniref:Sas10 C-terminal domain-containing protein n=1 Tax=Guillardia theta (strain CCMP2712) TaxID=905079 RepID=L1IIF7_GUITC|nr:hypothetical protein GUITHDRAFT_118200 [Guillardia theta CCMP2712]EKX35600.1 hypothetical protein GUITHDRAFT_118200 [Guillardia theta CCMP2712]|eukprot:XP_005822580.1 hypothetical protein GUITHDRAFT_118200 [Guillardia theta CCMP2712]
MRVHRRLLLSSCLFVVAFGGDTSRIIVPDLRHGSRDALDVRAREGQCLRLRGGKLKYKNLREVKQQRLADERLAKRADARRKQKSKGRVQQKEKTPRRKPQAGEQEPYDSDDVVWQAGAKDEDLYGDDSVPSDEAEREIFYEAQEKEARRIVEKIKEPSKAIDFEEALQAPELSDEFPPDSESRGEPLEEEGRMAPQTYLEMLFGDDVEAVSRPEGLSRLLDEMQSACNTIREFVEPVVMCLQLLSRDIKSMSAPESILFMKYSALTKFVENIQGYVIMKMEGSKDSGESRKFLENLNLLWSELKIGSNRAKRVKIKKKPSTPAVKSTSQDRRMDEIDIKLQKEERFEEALESKDLDPTVALDKGSQFWRRKLKEAKQLHMIVREDKRELNTDEQYKAERLEYFQQMSEIAKAAEMKRSGEDQHQRIEGTVLLEGGRRPASYGMLTNTVGVKRRYRNRRDSNPRLRLRHKYHNLIIRARGKTRKVRTEKEHGYVGEETGINPKAKHSVNLKWDAKAIRKI